ncbi:hypothetical protein MF271_03205 [Deinococcus sp. KNUC1210]|uniref:hypothetical protein n=1 Tax=Deinococcus sp. KNUC1210 TaxID=2917691 RepID=UPI001EEF7F84|nr:hypothetical protein [Deinococcus sp. KNUC1210]ULH15662.1 hypothetical protein MF271_03205 [Deinococcus sp. KNUC1210]
MNARRLFFLTPLLSALLGACSLITPDLTLNFQPGPAGGEIDPTTLLHRQIVPADRLVTWQQAFDRAPVGSVILTCWKDTDVTNFWGPCSHVTRKYSAEQVAETYSFSRPLAGVYPVGVEAHYYALIVLDTGVKPEMLDAMWKAAHRLDGKFYTLANIPDQYYCSTYQNALQQAVGLPDAVPYNSWLNINLPSDALKMPGVKVLWVGINPDSPQAYRGDTSAQTVSDPVH